jgi:tyrosinase
MGIRKSAAQLTPQERDQFLEAVIRLKHKRAPSGPPGFSVYDQFVALHGAVMAVRSPGAVDPVNFAHWNPGFCPWHREYILRFEKALQAEVSGATLPYWDWADHLGMQQNVFVPDFLGPLIQGGPAPLPAGVLGFHGPTPRPAWWPANAQGFRVHPALQEIPQQATLHRGSVGESWPPSPSDIQVLVTLDPAIPNVHRLWLFWLVLEQGAGQLARTHNAGHRFVGGHMAGAFSPNDPVFWMHHANVDRLWSIWQANMVQRHAGTTPPDHYPPQGDLDPWQGSPLPPGHNLDDFMWPWVGNTQGYAPEPAYAPLLIDYSQEPARRVRDVLDIGVLGYSYG